MDKLPDLDHKSPEDAFSDILKKLEPLKKTELIENVHDCSGDEDSVVFANTVLCCDFVELSRGELIVEKEEIIFGGSTLSVYSTANIPLLPSNWLLGLNYNALTDVRTKSLIETSEASPECTTAVMFAVNETVFLQILMEGTKAVECLAEIKKRKEAAVTSECEEEKNIPQIPLIAEAFASSQASPVMGSSQPEESSQEEDLLAGKNDSNNEGGEPFLEQGNACERTPSVLQTEMDEAFRIMRDSLKEARDRALQSIDEAYQRGLRDLQAQFLLHQEVGSPKQVLGEVTRCDIKQSNEHGSVEIFRDGSSSTIVAVSDDDEGDEECGICCDERVSFKLQPCGHALCSTCYKRISEMESPIKNEQSSATAAAAMLLKCPFDRNRVSNVVPSGRRGTTWRTGLSDTK
ncbi:hypothetical protein HDU67_003713 [Dinochytrium kinnereticum]|nr:hypothetical protein HDU67_003713 [Dinochytrium kinnereticum]